MEVYSVLTQIADATVRVSVPLLLAALAGLYSERSGIFDIGLEGKMLAGAFAAGAAAYVSGSAWIGLGVAIIVSIGMSLVHAALSRWRKAFERDENRHTDKFYRIINEVPAVLLIGILILVVVKPF